MDKKRTPNGVPFLYLCSRTVFKKKGKGRQVTHLHPSTTPEAWFCSVCPPSSLQRLGRNQIHAMATRVGPRAATKRPSGLMPSSPKLDFRMPKPAGFGALAMTVRPPPATAPATSAYFEGSLRPSTREPRYVSAALSVIAVRPVALRNRGRLPMVPMVGCSHQCWKAPMVTRPARKKPTSSPSLSWSGSWYSSVTAAVPRKNMKSPRKTTMWCAL